MKTAALLLLVVTLLGVVQVATAQTSGQFDNQTVALILGPEPTRVEILSLEEAQQEYKRLLQLNYHMYLMPERRMRFTALTLALGTVPETPTVTEAERRCALQKIQCWWCECKDRQ